MRLPILPLKSVIISASLSIRGSSSLVKLRPVQYRQSTELLALLTALVVADAESSKGFLDGEALKDYMTSTVLSPDCTFSSYSVEFDNAVAAS